MEKTPAEVYAQFRAAWSHVSLDSIPLKIDKSATLADLDLQLCLLSEGAIFQRDEKLSRCRADVVMCIVPSVWLRCAAFTVTRTDDYTVQGNVSAEHRFATVRPNATGDQFAQAAQMVLPVAHGEIESPPTDPPPQGGGSFEFESSIDEFERSNSSIATLQPRVLDGVAARIPQNARAQHVATLFAKLRHWRQWGCVFVGKLAFVASKAQPNRRQRDEKALSSWYRSVLDRHSALWLQNKSPISKNQLPPRVGFHRSTMVCVDLQTPCA